MKPIFQRRFAMVILVVCLLLVIAPEAFAHARLLRAAPAGGAEVSAAPAQLDLWFNELLESGFNFVTVFPASELGAKKHANLAKGKPVVDARDRTHLTVPLQPLPPGEYIVEWRVLSRDGHTAPGRLTFRVRAR